MKAEQIDAMDVILKAVTQAGTQAAFATKHGMSAQFVNDVVNRRKDPSKAILEAVGLERVVSYRKKAKVPS